MKISVDPDQTIEEKREIQEPVNRNQLKINDLGVPRLRLAQTPRGDVSGLMFSPK